SPGGLEGELREPRTPSGPTHGVSPNRGRRNVIDGRRGRGANTNRGNFLVVKPAVSGRYGSSVLAEGKIGVSERQSTYHHPVRKPGGFFGQSTPSKVLTNY